MSGLAFNTGVDCNGYRPLSVDEVVLMAEKVDVHHDRYDSE
jgi:calcineurin-like phosphoesterase family protein